ncbi:MAG: tetratricopeptide repeat protein, partial [Pseudomonadota bacterium]
ALRRRSLLDVPEDGDAATYRLHRVTQAVIRRRLGDEARRWAETAAAVVAAGYPAGGDRHPAYPQNWPACRRRNGQVAALHVLPPALRPECTAMDVLYNQAGIYFSVQRQDALALAYAEAYLRLKESRPVPDQCDLNVGYGNLAVRLGRAGRLEEAEAAAARAVELGTEAAMPAADRAIDLSNHGARLQALGAQALAEEAREALFDRARRRFHEALRLDRNEHGVPSRDVANRLNNIGGLHSTAGRTGKALVLWRAALSMRRRLVAAGRMDAADPALGYSLNNLGSALLRAGQPVEAAPLLEEGLALWRAAHDAENPQHPYTGGTARWLAVCLATLHRLEGGAARGDMVRALCADYGRDPAGVEQAAAQLAEAARAREGTG